MFLCGDMNCTPDGAAVGKLMEKWEMMSPLSATYPSDSPESCIDYIFCLKSAQVPQVLEKKVISDSEGFKMSELSDHLPVIVRVKCK